MVVTYIYMAFIVIGPGSLVARHLLREREVEDSNPSGCTSGVRSDEASL